MDSNAAFKARLQTCVQRLGSAYALARKSGIPGSTLKRYFTDSEPTRPKLIAIATAANVPVEWLVAGVGSVEPKRPAEGPTEPLPASATEQVRGRMGEDFYRRLADLVRLHGGVELLSETTGIAVTRIEQLLSGAELTLSEFHTICTSTRTPVAWIYGAKGIDQQDRVVIEHALRDLLAEIEIIEADRPRGFHPRHTLSHSAWSEGSLPAVFVLWLMILQELRPDYYRIMKVENNLMSPTLERNDIAVVRLRAQPTQPGVYLFKNGPGEFFARCVTVGQPPRFSFDNPQYDKAVANQLLSAGENTECLGYVCFVFGPP